MSKCLFCLKFKKNIIYFLLLLSILLLSRNIEINPNPGVKSNRRRVLYHNIRGLYKNIEDLQISSHTVNLI